VLIGQIFVGMAQPYFMASPSKLSALWFSAPARPTTTSLGVLSWTVGMGLSFLAPDIVKTAADFTPFLLGQLLLCVASLLLHLCFFNKDVEATNAPEESLSLNTDEADVDPKVWAPLAALAAVAALAALAATHTRCMHAAPTHAVHTHTHTLHTPTNDEPAVDAKAELEAWRLEWRANMVVLSKNSNM
jgi:hypothetical protein